MLEEVTELSSGKNVEGTNAIVLPVCTAVPQV